MTFDPFLDAHLITQAHAVSATLALILGPVLIARTGGRRVHRVLGYIWVIAMSFAALSSFAIHDFAMIGPLSPIHLLAVLALWSIFYGMRAILRGDVKRHKDAMRSLYWRGLLVAAAFNFLPGRVVNRMFFDDMRLMGFVPLALIVSLILSLIARDIWRGRQRARGLTLA